jgi:enoyl-CoA hydratase/carnithine racemase
MNEGTPTLAVAADGTARITLARPAHLNRLQREDLLALQTHFETLRHDPAVRALVLTGEGRAFCAGFHLGQLGEAPDAGPQLFERRVDALEALPLPSVARLNGSVYGGATDLALACDFRVGVTGMALRMPAARLGLHYYPSGLRSMPSGSCVSV